METQATDWEKILAKLISDKASYIKLFKFNNKKTKNPIQKWSKDPNKDLNI